MISLAGHASRVIHLSYTGRHIHQRTMQLWRVVTSKDLYRFIRLIVFVMLDMLLGLCLAHLLRRLFVTPQRSIGMTFKYTIFKNNNFIQLELIQNICFFTFISQRYF